ncbi:MAG TPA: valine--tRNA ligase [Rickettsiales bacterium]|nr:valine--tRNA ligase [Rickettsiales bacterium]
MTKLNKKYIFAESEKKWQEYWQEAKIFQFNWNDTKRENIYSIDTPPPHVSGALHMGHIFGYSQMDTIARFQRMSGKNVFYPVGFDDNGLPSERYVEKKLNIKSKSIDRQEFVKICDKEIQDAEQFMKEEFIKMNYSFDFDEAYRTISPTARKVSQMSFIDLCNKNKVYRKEEPIIWDVVDQTALAQTEAEDAEKESQMNYLKFELTDGKTREQLEIMTTRPELLPACVAIFTHPDNKDKYLGKKAITPLGVEVPILFDETVDKEKGTGVMMCCTFGDNADVEKYKKYNLPLKIIINEKGCLYFDNVPEIDEKYKSELNGLFTTKAREKILEILNEEGKITREPEKIIHAVKVGERSKSPLEILVKSQWNINVLDIKDELHKKADEVQWHPEWMKGRIHSWIDGLSWNWTISRQRFFGVPVPCWYSKKDGSVILPSMEQLPVDPTVDLPKGYTKDEVIGETDVFDTWMTSSVSPQLSTQSITEELTCDKERAKTLNLPFDLRTQGHDIIRTWAFCTLTKAYLHQNIIPWKNIFVNGFCLASDGTKMSKSKGNGVDPVKTINEFGADAVRYWALSSQLGTDTNYSIDMIKMGQKLITKLFNSAKFAEMMFDNLDSMTPPSTLRGRGQGLGVEHLYSEKTLEQAKKLRQESNLPEKILWEFLRNNQLNGLKFKRQQPIDKYIVDFACLSENVIIEIDGKVHEIFNKEKDELREEALRKLGYRIIRFKANEVVDDTFGVLDKISEFVNKPLTPTPSPQGGRGSNLSNAQQDISNGLIFETIDKWLISRIYSTITQATKSLENYEYGKALEVIDSFFWNDFCDNYLEIVKVRCYGANGTKYQGIELSKEEKEKIDREQQSAIRTIYYVFNAILKLYSPFTPAICDEIYSCVYENEFNQTKSVSSRGNWAKSIDFVENKEIDEIGKVILNTITNVRKEKSEKNISIKELIDEVKIESPLNEKISKDIGLIEDLKNVCNAKKIRF